MPEYKYKLSATSKKYTCPGCVKRTFVPYVYADTKEIVDSYQYGRCDRENSCSYHRNPAEDKQFTPSHTLKKPELAPEVIQVFPGDEIVDAITRRTKTCVSPFHAYCKKLGIPMEHLLEWGVYSDGANGELTAFLVKDTDNKVCNIKYFKYQKSGKRDKEFKSFSLKQPPHTPPKKNIVGAKKKSNKYLLSLFGSHLLSPRDDGKIVALVESEKTAVIASWFYKHFDWLSCGSNNGLGTSEGVPDDFKIKTLVNRQVIWLSDADKAGRDNTSIKKLKKYGIDHCILDLHPDDEDGRDIADDIEMGVRPDVIFVSEKEDKRLNESHNYNLPKDVEWDKVKSSIFKYKSFVHSNRFYVIRKPKSQDDQYYAQSITNFSIKSLGHIESVENPRRLLSIKNVHGLTKELEVPTKAFASNTEFTVFVESEGNFQYDGVGVDLKRIRAKLYDTMVTYKEVDTLGWRDAAFFFANGVYHGGSFKESDKYGFVELGKNKAYFIPALSIINKHAEEDWEDEQKFVYVKSKVTLKAWSKLFCQVHKDNGIITVAWYMASLFRDVIYRQFKFFPHMFLFGPPGTGKSQVGWSIRAMGFKGIKKPFSLSGGTKVAFHREFAHFCNFPAWFDEYDNAIDYDRIQSLKAAYDGAGHKKSVKDSDKRTKSVPVSSSCMISGQQMPIADVALFMRVILSQFDQTEYNDNEKELFKKLLTMEDGGLSHITARFMTFRQKVEQEYFTVFDEVMADFIKSYEGDVADRIMKNMVVIATMVKLLEDDIGDSLPFDYEAFKLIALRYIREQMSLINRSNETNVFWDMMNFLIDTQSIHEEQDYLFREKLRLSILTDSHKSVMKELDHTKNVLMIRMSKIIPLYKENFKRQSAGNSTAMDKNSLLHYLQNQKYYIGYVKSVKFEDPVAVAVPDGNGGYSQKKRRSPQGAYVFDYEMMEQYGINLMRGGSEQNINNAKTLDVDKEETSETLAPVKQKDLFVDDGSHPKPPF